MSMQDESIDSRFEQAIIELRDYLSDLIPPLVASDSIEILMTCPPGLVATSVNSWVAGQYRPSSTVPRSDYFFHALKKIHMIGEYKLVAQKDLAAFLERMKPHILSFCPPPEREMLSQSLERMDETVDTSSSSPVDVMYRQTSGETKRAAGVVDTPASLESEVGRIGQLLQRIKRDLETISRSGERVSEEKQEEVLAQVLAQTGHSAKATIEIEQALEYIKQLGIQAGTQDVFRALGRNLPEWSFAPGTDLQLPEDSNLKVMRRIVTETGDPKESATRFHQMIRTAVERLNEGHLQSAVNMIDLAEKIISAKEVNHATIQNLKRQGHEDVDFERLKKYSDAPDQYAALKKVLQFFDALNPPALVETLRAETKRDRRRLLLSLLECHGDATRDAALSILRHPFSPNGPNEEVYLRRNLLYLLRRIPPPSSQNLEELVRIVSQHTDPDFPPIVTKEAIAALGQIKHKESERVLSLLLADTEERLAASAPSEKTRQWIGILDRIAASLGRLGTSGSRKILIDHALSRKQKWGNTVARLQELAGQDLSSDPQSIQRLLTALQSSIPNKILGLFGQKKDQDMKIIAEALASTNTADVRGILDDLRQRFPDIISAESAVPKPPVQFLESPLLAADQKKIPNTAASLSGDLDLFGLPGLFQSLSDHGLTGTLTLTDPQGSIFATVDFHKGRLVSCRNGALSGETGIFQLLERPQPGTFQFARNETTDEGSSKEMLPLLMEGIRRYDELRQLQAILPDSIRLGSTAVKPSALPEERDGLLFRDLWNVVRTGATPEQCESAVPFDSYRIRRLLLHWFETGSITHQ